MRSIIREVLETIILTVIIFLLVRSVVQNFKVDGRSMEPSLQTGQYLLINKAAYWRLDAESVEAFVPAIADRFGEQPQFMFGGPQRGDVIVFRYPKDPSRDFVKRIIALPGDIVEIKQGKVFVNSVAVEEDYLLAQPNYFLERQIVPDRNYFVLGDNRNNSSDSHVWGNVPLENIIGRAWIRYWPPERWGFLSSGRPAEEIAR